MTEGAISGPMRENIAAVFDAIVTPERMAEILEATGATEVDDIVPAYNDWERRKDFLTAVALITRDFMEGVRKEGVLAPCPNNGPRRVRSMNAWNAWLAGGFDNPMDTSRNHQDFMEADLPESPAFDVISESILRMSVDAKREKSAENPRSVTPAAVLEKARLRARDIYLQGSNPFPISSDLRCSISGEKLFISGSFYTPVLGVLEGMKVRDLPPLETPKLLRHLEISLPSGRLAMADWFRIPGFKEGLDALTEENYYSINNDDGLDLRTQHCFENAGIVMVQVGNSSPAAYAEGEDIWRLGFVDEDHDAFWTDEGEPRDVQAPEPVWKTCTDLWANTFADPERIVDILMVSGVFADRQLAMEALEDYCADTHGASIVELGVEKLHLYIPTGYGTNSDFPPSAFNEEDLPSHEWQEDYYILSARPLEANSELVEEPGWVEGNPAQTAAPSLDL